MTAPDPFHLELRGKIHGAFARSQNGNLAAPGNLNFFLINNVFFGIILIYGSQTFWKF